MSGEYVYLQRANRRGWVHYQPHGSPAHVTTKSWALWFRAGRKHATPDPQTRLDADE